jgi:hypothetical protein
MPRKRVRINLASSEMTLMPGETQRLHVKIDRMDGYKGAFALSLVEQSRAISGKVDVGVDSTSEDLEVKAPSNARAGTYHASFEARTNDEAVDLGFPRPSLKVTIKEPKLPIPFVEDFKDVKEGDLPKGWTGPSVGVVPAAGKRPAHLCATPNGKYYVVTPRLDFPQNFQLDIRAGIGPSTNLEIILEGENGTGDVPVQFYLTNRGLLEVQFPGAAGASLPIGLLANDNFVIQLARVDDVYRLTVNGQRVHEPPPRLSKPKDFCRLKLGLDRKNGPTGVALFSGFYEVSAKKSD